MKRNGIISLWKFIFATTIVLFHGQIFFSGKPANPFFRGGYIGVEFFFLVSGYFFAKSVMKKKYNKKSIGKDTISFIYNRLKKLIPYIIIAYVLALSLLFFDDHNIYQLIVSIWNVLLLRVFGFKSVNVLVPAWYISVLILTMFITYPALVKHKENYILRVSPLIVVFGLGYLSQTTALLDLSIGHWKGFIELGLIRGIAEMNLGMIIFYISDSLKKIKYTKLFTWIITIMGELLLICVLIGVQFVKVPGKYDMIYILMMSIALLIISSTKTYDYKLLSNRFVYYLEKLTIPIFLNQAFFVPLLVTISKKIDIVNYHKSIYAYVLTLIFSIIELLIIDYLKKKKINDKIKPLIIKEI